MELARECLYVGLNPHAIWHSMRQVRFVTLLSIKV